MALVLVGCRTAPKADPKTPEGEELPESGSWEAKPAEVGGDTAGNPSGPPVVNYPGFEVLNDGRSVVSIQVRGPVQVTETRVEGRIVYSLTGVAVPERVNRLPLLTQHFPTQVTSVTVEQTPTGANLIIETREPATSTFSIKQNQAGSLVSIVVPRSEKYGTKDPSTDPTNFERPTSTTDATTDNAATDPATNEPGEGYSDETERRRRKSKRQPKPYVERPLTLPFRTLAPDLSVSAAGFERTSPTVHLASGVRYGIIDQVEFEGTLHSFRLSPYGGYVAPSFGLTAGYTGHPFEIAGRVRYFLPIDSYFQDPDNLSDLVGEATLADSFAFSDSSAGSLVLGVPMHIHLGTWGRLDTGGFLTMDFVGSSSGIEPVFGLKQREASPFITSPGVPLYLLLQPVPEFWLGAHHGLTIGNFDFVEETLALPIGAELGITASNDFNPVADLALHLDFPQFFLPGRSGDVVEENAYQLAAVFRWFHHM